MSLKKKRAIVTGGTKNQFPAMAVLALNISDKCPNIADELVIFHDGVPPEEQQKVQQVFPTRFIEYKSPFQEKEKFNTTITNYFSFMVFCKYECWRLLDDYETVIWSDYDVVILDDISEIGEREKFSAKFVHNKFMVTKFERSFFWNFGDELNSFDILGDCISCGIFVLHDDFPEYASFYEDCIALTQKYGSALWTPEEAVISILLQQRDIPYDEIDPVVYVTQPRDFEKNKSRAKILHAAGQPKFWNGLENEYWGGVYNIWLTEYKGASFESLSGVEKKPFILRRAIKCLLPYGVVRLVQRRHEKE